jgi:hypothetical protein
MSLFGKNGVSLNSRGFPVETKMRSKMKIENMSKDEAMTYLISEEGLSFKEATVFWSENRPKGGTGFAGKFYAALKDGEMTEADFDAFLADESKNVKNHRSHYNSIRELVNEVRLIAVAK